MSFASFPRRTARVPLRLPLSSALGGRTLVELRPTPHRCLRRLQRPSHRASGSRAPATGLARRPRRPSPRRPNRRASSRRVIGHRLWPSALAIGFGHRLWPSSAAIGFGHRLRPSSSAISFGHRLRPSASTIGFSHQLRPPATATGLGPWPRRQPHGLGSPGWPQRQLGILSAFSRHIRRSPPRFSGNSFAFFLGSRLKRRLLLSILQLTRIERRRWQGWHKRSPCEGSYDEPSRSVDGFGNRMLRCRSYLPARFTNISCATARLTSST